MCVCMGAWVRVHVCELEMLRKMQFNHFSGFQNSFVLRFVLRIEMEMCT